MTGSTDANDEAYTGSCTRTQLWQRIKTLEQMLALRAATPTTKPSGEAVVRKYTLEEVAVNYVAADKPVFEAWLDREIRASTPPTTKEPK